MNQPSTAITPARPGPRAGRARMPGSPGPRRAAATSLRVEIEFSKVDAITSLGAHAVGPHLDEACAATRGTWWFLRDASGWHVHLDGVDRARIALALNRLVQRGILQDWTTDLRCAPSPVGPTTGSVIGGLSCDRLAPGAATDLHRADSRGTLAYLRELGLPETHRSPLRTAHVLGILARTVCTEAGFDAGMSSDVLDSLARRNAGGLNESARVRAHGLTDLLTLLWQAPASHTLGGAITPWATDLLVIARSLGSAAQLSGLPHAEGVAHLRAQLQFALAAQWDRLGLTRTDQTILAVATRGALRRRAS